MTKQARIGYQKVARGHYYIFVDDEEFGEVWDEWPRLKRFDRKWRGGWIENGEKIYLEAPTLKLWKQRFWDRHGNAAGGS